MTNIVVAFHLAPVLAVAQPTYLHQLVILFDTKKVNKKLTNNCLLLLASGHRVLKIVTETHHSSSMSGGASPFGQNAASAIRDSREREKKEMCELNDRLASYIEKVRFLEAQNRKLAADLELLKGRWGKDTHSIKTMYESELTVKISF